MARHERSSDWNVLVIGFLGFRDSLYELEAAVYSTAASLGTDCDHCHSDEWLVAEDSISR